jgi:uncharacterized repeat protein (TIGR01451 family)
MRHPLSHLKQITSLVTSIPSRRWGQKPGRSMTAAVLLTGIMLLVGALGWHLVSTSAQVSLPTLASPYTQNFDTLATTGTANTWTDNTTIAGWYSQFSLQPANPTTYRADSGGSNTGAIYSWGVAGVNLLTERALGSVGSGTPGDIYNAVRLVNNTGVTITSLTVNFTGEQWRQGGCQPTPCTPLAQKLDFQYQAANAGVITDANTPTTGWLDHDALDFTSPQPGTSTAAAIDGNAAANRTALSSTVAVTINPGQEIWLRWKDINDVNNDHGLAIDDLSVTPNGAAVTPTLNISDVTLAEGNPPGTTTFTFAVTLTSPAGAGGVTFDIATADGTAQDDNPATEDNDYVAQSLTGQSIPMGSTGPYNFSVTVNRDTTAEPNETFFVNVTSITGANAGDVQGQGTITNDDITVTSIYTIQGSGDTSPLAGQTVTTTGIVTLLRTGSNAGGGAANGFFLQDPTGDANTNTSDGIFVFTSSVPTVAVGDSVQVTGTVVDFNGLTEISPVTNVIVLSTGNSLPAAVALSSIILDQAAMPTQPQLEKYEGMRLSGASLRSVAPNDDFYDVYTVLSAVARPLREPGITSGDPIPPDPTSGTQDTNIPIWDKNPERLKLDTNGRAGSPLNAYTSNVTFTNVVGPLDFAFSEYRLIPEAPLTASANLSAVSVPTPAASEFTVAGYNIENFNNNATQRQKAALTIRDVLRLPDIIGTVEIFDLADLQALAAEIQTISGVTYSAHLIEQDGTSEDSDQDVGFLVKTSRVSVTSVTAERTTDTFINPNTGNPELLHDRPPLVLRGTVNPMGPNPQPVIVVVNHLRSFIDIELVAGEGPRVRAKRKAQSESLAGLLQELQTNNAGVPVISVGDYNAFQFNSGYDDSISVLKGMPTADDQIVVDQSPDLVNPNFYNLIEDLMAAEQYTFIFEGTPQALDHVLVNTIARALNTRIAVARVNADFPELPASAFAGNAAIPERNSDHDPVVAYFTSAPDLAITKSDGGASVTPGGTVAYTLSYANNGGATATGVVLTETVPVNTTFNPGASTPGWSCTPDNNAGSTCTLAVGAVNAGGNGTATFAVTVANPVGAGVTQISNTASIADDGANGTDPTLANNSGSDTTPVNVPDLTVDKSHTGNFTQGQVGAQYFIAVINAGTGAASGTVTVTDTLPAGLTATAMSGPGWVCMTATLTCTRSDALAANSSYAAITLTVNVAPAAPPSVTNSATVSGGGEGNTANNTDTDPTTITAFGCPSSFTVNDSGDASDATPGDGVCATSSAVCTLRAAVMEANALAAVPCAPLTINFSVTGVISLATALPALNHPNLTISGPGASQLTVRRSTAMGTPDFSVFVIADNRIVTLSGLTISNGVNGFGGGGIFNGSSAMLTVSDCVVSGNSAGAYGGGIFSFSILILNNCLVTSNHAVILGGGIQMFGGNLTMSGSTVSANTSGNSAGGIEFDNGAYGNLVNSTISGNTAATFPGGIRNFEGTLTLTNCTVANNQSNGAIGGIETVGTSVTRLRNTIVAGNDGPNLANSGGTFTSLGNNLTSDGGGGILDQPGDLINTNPLLAVLGNYGGATPTHALLPGSLAINAGGPASEIQRVTVSGTSGTFTLTFNGQSTEPLAFNASAAAVQSALNGLSTLGGGSTSVSKSGNVYTVTFGGSLGATDVPQLTGAGAGGALVTISTVLNGGTLATDQRGVPRPQLGAVDIGAFESRGFTMAIAVGNNQTTSVTTMFPNPLSVLVTSNFGEPVAGGAVTFTAPASGPSATLAGSPATINSTGEASVTATANNQQGTYQATAAANGANAVNFTLTNQCPAITIAPLPAATAGVPYNQTLVASPAGGSYSFALAGGSSLPPGFASLSASGQLAGTPTMAGTFTFNVVVTGFGGACLSTMPVTLVVACPAITLSPATLPNATVNAAYPQTISASPAGGNYSFSVTSGLLPAGLTLNSNGSFSGAPTQSGTFNFRVTATGFGGCSAFRDYVLIVECPGLSLNPASLPGGSVGTAYGPASVSASPAGTYSYAVSSGALPPGLTLNASTGAITGTPTTGGSFIFTVTASSGGTGSCTVSRTYTVAISCPAITLNPASPLTSGQAGVAYNATISALPADTYTFSLISGSLPSGLMLNPTTGAISGTATVTGTHTFTVKAQTANGCNGSQAYVLVINCPTVVVNPASLPAGTTGTAYSQTLSAAPAGGSYTYGTSGSLPTGLNLNPSTGILSGTTTANGSFTFTVTANGFGGCTGSRQYTVVIGGGGCPTITLPTSLPGGSVGQLYSNSVGASPAGSYTYSATGTLPTGVTLFAEIGLLFGYPTATGSYTFTITATQGACTGSQEYTVLIGAGFASSLTAFSDFDGDGKGDLSVFRGSDGNWLSINSGTGNLNITPWGAAYDPYNDLAVSGDYDGDGKTDQAVFRRGGEHAGYWFIKRSSDGQIASHFWGLPTDLPVPGDYDADGKTDVAVWRPSAGAWYIVRSSDGGIEGHLWGSSLRADLPVPGDYDSDGSTDLAVFRREDGYWHIQRSSDGSSLSLKLGVGTDVPVPGDYDGDGKTDIAVWRGSEGIWYIWESLGAALRTLTLGAAGDVPVATDYDGDGKADAAVWQGSTGTWTVKQSGNGAETVTAFGQRGDTPIMARKH